MTLTLGFSPCPNDTFLFDAMIHNKIDTEGLSFEVRLADVEALNRWAFAGELVITKLSYHAFGHVADQYALLRSGSALGNNCGPLLISKTPLQSDQLPNSAKVAIPGQYTTANFLLSLAFPALRQKTEMLFSDIETAVLHGQVDAGLIIHENRFTYAEKGLHKIIDLGEYWESTTGLPIPLGGIAIRRDYPIEVQQKVERVLRRSVEYALAHPNASQDYVSAHAQEMEAAVMQQHIALYVNHYTVDLGLDGTRAVEHLFAKAKALNILPNLPQDLFIPSSN